MHSTSTPQPLPAPAPPPVRDVSERLRARSRASGVMVMSGFGALWASGAIVLSGAPAWAWIVVASATVAFWAHALQLRRANPRVAGPLPIDVAERAPAGSSCGPAPGKAWASSWPSTWS